MKRKILRQNLKAPRSPTVKDIGFAKLIVKNNIIKALKYRSLMLSLDPARTFDLLCCMHFKVIPNKG